jgi:RND superfamily putative drug exporter
MGTRTHWIPKWLDRILPHVDIEGEKLVQKMGDADGDPEVPAA